MISAFHAAGRRMKITSSRDIWTAPLFVKIYAFAFISEAFFYLGKHLSESDGYEELLFFNRENPIRSSPSISISPNANKTFDVPSLISNHTATEIPLNSSSPPSHPPPPDRFGIVDRNGTMRDDFDVGRFDPDLIENGTEEMGVDKRDSRVKISRFPMCPESMKEYIPCLDNAEEIRKLKSTERGEKYERHCPGEGRRLNCLVPAPKEYKMPIPWPQSRDEVWYSNVPHRCLVEDKGGQNWISVDNYKFKFPGGGTQFIHGADQYLDQISQMVPDIAFGCHARVVLDVGCGVASFGAFLLSRNVTALSIAPKDVHENQIQFALERGVPAMVATFATHRLLYPSQAFDLIHCSRCRINWTRDGCSEQEGTLLRQHSRFISMKRAKKKHGKVNNKEIYADQDRELPTAVTVASTFLILTEMMNLTDRICWELVKKDGYIAIWRKPLNNSCYLNREAGVQPPLCDKDDDPDNVWYVNLQLCITLLPENGYGSNVTIWPMRLHHLPDRLQFVEMDASIAKEEHFKAESRYWDDIIASYIHSFHWRNLKLRNVMDMRAGFGGFAATLIDQQFDAWVMNVVPVSGPNTLPAIFDRGLIGVTHDWCEPFDTYPRTYDLLHAFSLFSTEQKSILLEMDRILRPGGYAYIHDSSSVIEKVQGIARAMGWKTSLHYTAEGPYESKRLLICDKILLRG